MSSSKNQMRVMSASGKRFLVPATIYLWQGKGNKTGINKATLPDWVCLCSHFICNRHICGIKETRNWTSVWIWETQVYTELETWICRYPRQILTCILTVKSAQMGSTVKACTANTGVFCGTSPVSLQINGISAGLAQGFMDFCFSVFLLIRTE